MIQIQPFVFNPFQENTYILSDETKEAIIIDPGCHTNQEKNGVKQYIEDNELNLVRLLNTHCHIDHVLGNQFIKNTYGLKLEIHEKELVNLEQGFAISQMYGIPNFEISQADSFLEEGEKIIFGDSELDILFVPGHAPGHLAFISHAQKFIIGGDVLFRESIGRTDFPNCNHQDLIDSIQNKLFTLSDEYVVYSGHYQETTIGHEKKYNPFVR